MSQIDRQAPKEVRRLKGINGIGNKRSFLERSICILAIISIIVCQEALNCILGSWWMALPAALAIHSIYIVFWQEVRYYLIKIFLFTLSSCILYVGLVQMDTASMNYRMQIALNSADAKCCDVLKRIVEEEKVHREMIVEKYIQEIQDKMEENLADGVPEEQLFRYLSLLREQISIMVDETIIQDTLDNIYQIMMEVSDYAEEEVFLNYDDVQNSVFELIEVEQVEADILDLFRNEEVKVAVVVNPQAWIERVGDIALCKKKLKMHDRNNNFKDLDEAVADMVQQLKVNILDLEEFVQCIRSLFKPQSQYWDRLLICAVAAVIINVLEVLSVHMLVKLKGK